MSINLNGVGLTHANGHVALQDINLQVSKGERIAIIGPSGAGKTTLLGLLASGLKPLVVHLAYLISNPGS